ncbi:hypothetical protein AMEX_G26344 [Astyanax mexicanus]|uniref:Uncharacterized protein n=1 Tax=Astyanax mexicanus TaxID=7994 RepID=A0A8T2KPR2_ASTMX|nr:hypothetical protein AMEX_G26344 [Astyanax mexicanus]
MMSPHVIQRLWITAQHATTSGAKTGLTSRALKKIERQRVFSIPNALSVTHRARESLPLKRACTGFCTGSLYGLRSLMGALMHGYPPSPRMHLPADRLQLDGVEKLSVKVALCISGWGFYADVAPVNGTHSYREGRRSCQVSKPCSYPLQIITSWQSDDPSDEPTDSSAHSVHNVVYR